MSRPAALEQRLGHRFSRIELLEQALTHGSFGADNNERLEFVGDGVLDCVVAEELYARFPRLPEGKLTRLRASLVREETLAEAAREIGLSASIRLGETERAARDQPRPSILADTLEAVLGAVLLDGGYDAARKAVLAVLGARLDRLDPDRPGKDAKTQLQEILQERSPRLPEYRVLSTQGEAHSRRFEVECAVPDLGLRTAGTGTSRQRAEQDAAQAMLAMLAKT